MRAILQGWNFMRIIRLVLGVVILVQGIITKDFLTAVLGILFAGMAIANAGCCGTNGCAVNTTRPIKSKANIEYEEVDTIK